MSSSTKRKRDETPPDIISATTNSSVTSKSNVEAKPQGDGPPTKKPAGCGVNGPTGKSVLHSAAATMSSLKTAAWKPPSTKSNNKGGTNALNQRSLTPKAGNTSSKAHPSSAREGEKSNNHETPAASFIDEIINEANDLLQAAREAQSLGRLRSSASYLLLAHARLVGLGRRFDRSRCLEDELGTQSIANSDPPESVANTDKTSNSTTQEPPPPKNPQSQPTSIVLPPMPITHNALSDVALMENLARAGMELHHKRTGRGMLHDAQMEKMANSAIPVRGKATSSTLNENNKSDENETPTKRKGGRGKKPPTLVMHTLLGAELDAKKLMQINR
eukprot:CCRYP_013901-RA/>CCRYP_013901-RA protein AED:0.18 eAED:0.18 QI:0/-1/0/1/-1/1/1/0/331